MKLVVLEFIALEIEANRSMERVWAELVPKLEGEIIAGEGSSSVGGGQPQEGQQPAMASIPPSQPPPAVPVAPAHVFECAGADGRCGRRPIR